MNDFVFFIKPNNKNEIIDLQIEYKNSIGWHDGAEWAITDKVNYQGNKRALPSNVSWLPKDWNTVEFLGWNRFGIPVVLKDGERYVRRGVRLWVPIKKNDILSEDVLYFKKEVKLLETVSCWASLGIFKDSEQCIAWLTAMNYSFKAINIQSAFENKNAFKQAVEEIGQVEYKSLSENPHFAFLPLGIAKETSLALSNWKKKNEPLTVDQFIEQHISLTSNCLSGEQVDAVALAIDSIKNNFDFLLGDQTGLGKGRILASIALWAQKNNLIPIFFTERAGLFHDFWRDVEDVSGNNNPFEEAFLLHSNARLTYPDGSTWKSKYNVKERQRMVAQKELPKSVNLILTTYSQFNRKDPEKLDFIKHIGDRAVFLFDEAHNATGQSNIRLAMKDLKTKRGCIYSSATFGKDANHVSFYTNLLGKNPYLSDWNYWLSRTDAEPLRVSVSKRLVASGKMVRREQDLSGLKHSVSLPSAEEQNNITNLVDSFAKYCTGMLKLQTELADNFTPKPTSKVDPQRLFGGRIYNLNRLMFLVYLIPSVIRIAKEDLERGVKPIFVCETTLEQFLSGSEEEGDKRIWSSLASILNAEMDDLVDKWELPSSYARTQLYARLSNFKNWVNEAFSQFSPSPMDYVKQELNKLGLKVGEVSGRKTRLVFDEKTNIWTPESMNLDRVDIVRNFNNGDLDALLITRAGCSGISLHSSSKFNDKKPRELYEWQIPRNVAERVQFWGRVYRKGQVAPSGITSIFANTPSERRNQIWQSRKIKQLFQFTVGQSTHMGEVAGDYLDNSEADHWAKIWCQHYGDWASVMGLNGFAGGKFISWMDRVFSRLPMLSIKKQEAIINFWDASQNILFPSSSHNESRIQVSTIPLDEDLSLNGYLINKDKKDTATGFSQNVWQGIKKEFKGVYHCRTIFDKLKGIQEGSSIKWKDFSRRKVVTGRVVGIWVPPEPFSGFWHAISIQIWSPELSHSVWISFNHILKDDTFMIQDSSFSLDASLIAYEELHKSYYALSGNSEKLMLWKAHHGIGHWSSRDPSKLYLPSFIYPEKFMKMTTPIGQPVLCARYLKMFKDKYLYAYDAAGNTITISLHGKNYRVAIPENAKIDDGDLITMHFRSHYGVPIKAGMGVLLMQLEQKEGISLLFHLYNRGLIFGVLPEDKDTVENWCVNFQTEQESVHH